MLWMCRYDEVVDRNLLLGHALKSWSGGLGAR